MPKTEQQHRWMSKKDITHLRCHKCGRTNESLKLSTLKWQQHITKPHPHQCTKCTFQFVSPDSCKHHMSQIHRLPPQCSKCHLIRGTRIAYKTWDSHLKDPHEHLCCYCSLRFVSIKQHSDHMVCNKLFCISSDHCLFFDTLRRYLNTMHPSYTNFIALDTDTPTAIVCYIRTSHLFNTA